MLYMYTCIACTCTLRDYDNLFHYNTSSNAKLKQPKQLVAVYYWVVSCTQIGKRPVLPVDIEIIITQWNLQIKDTLGPATL